MITGLAILNLVKNAMSRVNFNTCFLIAICQMLPRRWPCSNGRSHGGPHKAPVTLRLYVAQSIYLLQMWGPERLGGAGLGSGVTLSDDAGATDK
jgi:hypothetical protein